MHVSNSDPLRRAIGRLTRCPTLAVIVLAATACADSAEQRREAVRAEAERQFGRPAAVEASPTQEDPPAAGGDPVPTPPTTDPDVPAMARDDEHVDPSAAPSAQEVDPDAILAGADAAYAGLSSLRAAFVQRIDVPLLDRTSQGHGVWYQEGRDRFRMEFIDPPEDVFVADGEFLWLWQPSANPNQVIKSALAGGSRAAGGADVLGRILSEARASYDAVYEGTAIVSGETTHVIALTPSGASDYRLVRIWVATGDRLVRRFRIEEENETIRTVTLASLEPDVPLADSLFLFIPPPGVPIFEP